MGKAQRTFRKVKRVEVEDPEARAFLKRVTDHSLLEEDYEIIDAMAETIHSV